MSILARIAHRTLAGGRERRYMGIESNVIPPAYEGITGDYVGTTKSMQNMAVYACVRLLADTVASLPWYAYKSGPGGVPEQIEPTPPLLRQPWPGFDLFQWKWMTVAGLALRGNSCSYIVGRNKEMHPTSMLPLHPDMVYVEQNVHTIDWTEPVYRVEGVRVPTADVVHMRRFTMPGEPWGMTPIQQAAVAIGLGLESEAYGYRYFRDSANPSSVLETDQELDDEAIRRQQQNWIASHGGRRRPAVLSGGFKWRPISISPNESQFLETRRYQRGEIAMMYGIPPHMIGDTEKSTSWGSGIEHQSIGFLTYTMRPWLSCIESTMSDLLPRGQFVRFDTSDLLRGDIKARFDAYKVARETGWINANEIRSKEDMEGIGPDGDIYLQPMNFAKLGYDPTKEAALKARGPKESPAFPPKKPDDGKGEGDEDGPPQPSEDSGRSRAAQNGHSVRVP